MSHSVSYQRVLIKFSGEFLSGGSDLSYCFESIRRIVHVIRQMLRDGFECGVVLGAGNLFRGKESASLSLDRVVGDQVGMLGTVMNALILQDALRKEGIITHVMAPVPSSPLVVSHNPLLARDYIHRGEPVIFAGGTGSNFFTTDTAATLRALEIDASLLVKATKVDGVYSGDPLVDAGAIRFSHISFRDVLDRGLLVMDHTAIALAMDFSLPVFVYKFYEPISLLTALRSEGMGTMVVPEDKQGR